MKGFTKVKSCMQIVILFLAFIIVSLIIFLLIVSPGKPKPFLDKNSKPLKGSISEKVFVSIGGVQQGMFIISRDSNNPVLLFVHGARLSQNTFWLINIPPVLRITLPYVIGRNAEEVSPTHRW
jgi:hypothetical protein